MKTFCPTHCFNYTGSHCPFCEQDKFAAYSRRYKTMETHERTQHKDKQVSKKRHEDTEITEDMLNALADKFGSKRK